MKQLFYSLITVFAIIIFFISCSSDYENGINELNNKNYEQALVYLKRVKNSDSTYNKAQSKIAEIDSLITITKEEKQKEEINNLKEQLTKEIEGISNFDGKIYRNEISVIQVEAMLFTTWAKLITDNESNKDPEIVKLTKTLKTKLVNLQKIEYPKMRKNYGDVVSKKLWENNITVNAKGIGYTTLEFIGGIFANNKNKQEMQNSLNEILTQLRFKRVNYKWFKNDDEYTYYTMETKKDSEL